MKGKFDIVVNPGQTQTGQKGKSIGTHDLNGCVAALIDNGGNNTVMHYGTFKQLNVLASKISTNAISGKTKHVYLCVPRDPKKLGTTPDSSYIKKLSGIVSDLRSKNIKFSFHGYKVAQLGRGKGIGGFDKNGKPTLDGLHIT